MKWVIAFVFFLLGAALFDEIKKRRMSSNRRLRSRFADDDVDEEGMRPLPRVLQLDILYRSGTREPSARVVDADRWSDDDGVLYIRGRCHLRNTDRTFRVERIERCIDRRTNQEIGDVEAYIRNIIRQEGALERHQ